MVLIASRSSRLVQLLRLRGTKIGVPSTVVDTQKPPLYQRVPPWWARWAVALIACDIFMTGSAIELTWNHWSQVADDSDEPTIRKQGDTPEEIPPAKYYTMRPAWQRLGLCAAHLGLGVGVAAALIVTQARFVRSISLTPGIRGVDEYAFVQCAHNFRKNGIAFPLRNCTLEEGRNETEIILRVEGERGHWYIGINEAFINGHPSSVSDAQLAIRRGFDGKHRLRGHWTKISTVDKRWKSGPVQRVN